MRRLFSSRVLRRSVALVLVGVAGLFAAVATAGRTDKPPWAPGPPTWAPGPPPWNPHYRGTTIAQTTVVTTTTTVESTATTPGQTVSSQSDPPASSGGDSLADLVVVSTAAPAHVFANQSITLDAEITNAGPADATGVQLAVQPGGMRILASTAPSGSIGELQSGATTHVTVTLSALPGSSFVTAVLHVGAAQLDPDPSNNSVLVQAAVLPGHPGPPGLTAGTGAFAPPLFARRVGKTWSVAARVHLDEVATITVQVRDTSGRVVPMLPGTTVDYLPALRPHMQIPHAVTGAGWVPLRVRVGGPVGRRYAIVVRAVGPDGSASRTTIAFRT